jgi:hypothetical protein
VDWLGEETQRALRAYAGPRLASVEVPRTTFVKQLAYLERKDGKAGAAAAAGVSVRTWNNWKAGRSRPNGPSIAKVKQAYEQRKRPELEKLRRTLLRKRLQHVNIQISGTIAISDYQDYRTNFAEQELRGRDLTGAWALRDDPEALAEHMTLLIQDATGVDAYWPLSDVDISLS